MPTILWSNGKRDTADSWQALLDKVRKDQPTRMSETRFRSEMDRRARLWSGVRLDVDAPAEIFFKELAYAKMIVILDPKGRSAEKAAPSRSAILKAERAGKAPDQKGN